MKLFFRAILSLVMEVVPYFFYSALFITILIIGIKYPFVLMGIFVVGVIAIAVILRMNRIQAQDDVEMKKIMARLGANTDD